MVWTVIKSYINIFFSCAILALGSNKCIRVTSAIRLGNRRWFVCVCVLYAEQRIAVQHHIVICDVCVCVLVWECARTRTFIFIYFITRSIWFYFTFDYFFFSSFYFWSMKMKTACLFRSSFPNGLIRTMQLCPHSPDILACFANFRFFDSEFAFLFVLFTFADHYPSVFFFIIL